MFTNALWKYKSSYHLKNIFFVKNLRLYFSITLLCFTFASRKKNFELKNKRLKTHLFPSDKKNGLLNLKKKKSKSLRHSHC